LQVANFNFLATFGASVWIAEIFGVRKLESLRYRVALFAWSYI